MVGSPLVKNKTTVFTPAPVNVPPGKSKTVCKLQFSSNSLRMLASALPAAPLLKNVFLITMAAFPPAFNILIKCCKKSEAVSPVLIGKFSCTSARSFPPNGGFANTTLYLLHHHKLFLLFVGQLLLQWF